MIVTIEMQENKIGETFEYEGKVLIVKKSNIHGCFKCAFGKDNVACHKFRCTPGGRKDGKYVHFEEVENGR